MTVNWFEGVPSQVVQENVIAMGNSRQSNLNKQKPLTLTLA